MLYRWAVSWLAALAISVSLLTPAAAQEAPPEAVPGEVLLRLNPGVSIRAVARAYRLVQPPGDISQSELRPYYRMLIDDGSSPETKAAQLSGDSRVSYAEPNLLVQSPEARQRSSWAVGGLSGDSYSGQWAAARIRLAEAHAVTRGAGVRVAILDTGADLAHPALAGRVAAAYDFVAEDGDPQEEDPGGPVYGHGTHVAGLVALSAPEAQLVILRTLDPQGHGTLWNQLRALNFAVAQGAGVINLSWSFERHSRILSDSLADLSCARQARQTCAGGTGVVIAAAAGNSGRLAPEYPAAYALPGVVAVSALDEENRLASFSSYGPWVRIAAPGDRVVSSVPGGDYAAWSGTSMATPLVAGTLALVRAANPTLLAGQAADRLVAAGAPTGEAVRWRLDSAAALGVPRPQ